MSKPREGLRAHLMRGAVGSVAISGCSSSLMLAVSVILARVLSPSGYGIYAFAIAVSGLLLIPAQMGMDKLLTREIAAGEAGGRWNLVRGLLRRSIQVVSLSTTLIAASMWLALWTYPLHVTPGERLALAVAVGLTVVNGFASVSGSCLMGLRRVIVAQIPMQVGRPALFLTGVVVVWILSGGRLDPVTAVAVNLVAATTMLVLLTVLATRTFRARAEHVPPSFETRRWLSSALPFVLMGGVGRINAQTDIVMLGFLTTAHTVGIYRVAATGAAMIIPLVLGAINGAISPTLAGLHSKGDRRRLMAVVRLASLAGLAGGVVMLIFFALWGKNLIRTIFGPAYVAAWEPLMILALGQTVNAGTGPVGVVLNMTGYERDAFWVLALSAVLNIALNGVLIPKFGVLGAASATATSTVTWNVLMTWRVNRRLSFLPFGWLRMPKPVV